MMPGVSTAYHHSEVPVPELLVSM